MKVLFAVYGGAHVAIAIPLIREFKRRGVEVVVVGLTTAGAVLHRENIPHRRVIDYVDVNDERIHEYGSRFLDRHHTDGIGISREESIAYLGVSYSELVDKIGEDEADRRYRELGLNAFLPVKFMMRVIAEETPDIVVATDSPRMERALLNAACMSGVPSVCVVALFPHIGMHYLVREDNGDTLCVTNNRIKQQLIEAGRNADSMIVTGNPAFDVLGENSDQAHRQQLRERRGLETGSKVILWAEQPEPGNPELPRIVRSHLNDICTKHDHWKYVVRLHPSSTDPKEEVIPPEAMVSGREDSLSDALLVADVVVTFTSTVAYEALLLDKPVVVLQMSQYDQFVDYSEEDGAFIIKDLDDVEAGLASLLDESDVAIRLRENRARLPKPGNATRDVADVIENQFNTTC